VTLLTDTLALEGVLSDFAVGQERIESSLDRYEPLDVQARRRLDATESLREATVPKLGEPFFAIFGDGDADDPGGSFWSEAAAAEPALSEARSDALKGVDWTRVQAEKTRLQSLLSRMLTVDEIERWYHEVSNDVERLTLEYHASELLRRFPMEESAGLRQRLERAHAERERTPAVRRAEERVRTINGQRLRALRAADMALSAIVKADGIFGQWSALRRARDRVSASVRVNALDGTMSYEFRLRGPTVRVITKQQG